MKKILIIITLSIFLITGCNEIQKEKTKETTPTKELKSGQMICTKKENIDGLDTDLKVTLDYKKNKIEKITNETKLNVEANSVNFYSEIYKGLEDIYKEVKGLTITTDSGSNYVRSILEIDYKTLDVETVKSVLNKLGESQSDSEIIVSENSLDIDRYKKQYLDGYTCN